MKAATSGSIVFRRENHLLLLSREEASDYHCHVLLEELLAPRGGGVVDEGERRDGILLKRRVVHTPVENQETSSFIGPAAALEAPVLRGKKYQLIEVLRIVQVKFSSPFLLRHFIQKHWSGRQIAQTEPGTPQYEDTIMPQIFI